MKTSLDKSVDAILKHEGGYANHPKDPGNETNYGITKRTAQRFGYFGSMKDLEKGFAIDIYRRIYWSAVDGDDLPAGVDLVVFDHGVNAGPRRAIKLLQRVVGASPDGIIGKVTLFLIDKVPPMKLIDKYSKARMSYYQRLRHWRTFGRGWSRRVNETRELALALAAMQP
jgi:lysozyme family protein